ncbi:MAG: 3-phosphoshikimate 1-carboxyvinyltransferase [Cyclobacteriaceae bacterium]
MHPAVHIQHNTEVTGTAANLPASKSISNRALILHALTNFRSVLHNLSAARDTRLMQQLVQSPEKSLNVLDAGTTMRFLTAYVAVTGQEKILTGTPRMLERPIKPLVDALRTLGASIDYEGREGFPPVHTHGFSRQMADVIEIPGNISSQYISALMMVAPQLPQGLTLRLTRSVASVPYIKMTAALMAQFGVTPQLNLPEIQIAPANYQPAELTIEADWSAASYWYAFVALADHAQVVLPHVTDNSLQGDRVIADLMSQLGVATAFVDGEARLTKKTVSVSKLVWDFKDCPDLAQTVLPVCAVLGIAGEFVGLESLRIKETDRIAALQNELQKLNCVFEEPEAGRWTLTPGALPEGPVTIQTYHDHRMAMGFAPLATRIPLVIQDPSVVDKSYPDFWADMQRVGFTLEKI